MFWALLASLVLCHTLARSVQSFLLHFTFMRLLHFTFTAIVSFNVYAHCKVRLSPVFGPRVDFELHHKQITISTIRKPDSAASQQRFPE